MCIQQQRGTKRDRERDQDRERGRETHRDKDRDKDRETQKERQRDGELRLCVVSSHILTFKTIASAIPSIHALALLVAHLATIVP